MVHPCAFEHDGERETGYACSYNGDARVWGHCFNVLEKKLGFCGCALECKSVSFLIWHDDCGE
jgi:hypothetical protein